jgi:hypothetical protein
MFKLKLFFVGILKVNDEKSRIRIQDPDPDPNQDPLVRGMDPRIRIRIRIHSKMSWIRNTAPTQTSPRLPVTNTQSHKVISWESF